MALDPGGCRPALVSCFRGQTRPAVLELRRKYYLLQRKSHVCVGGVSRSNTGFDSYHPGNWLTPGIKCLVFSRFATRPKFRAARSSSCTRSRRLHGFLQEKSFCNVAELCLYSDRYHLAQMWT